jgi:hypothetical protein
MVGGGMLQKGKESRQAAAKRDSQSHSNKNCRRPSNAGPQHCARHVWAVPRQHSRHNFSASAQIIPHFPHIRSAMRCEHYTAYSLGYFGRQTI